LIGVNSEQDDTPIIRTMVNKFMKPIYNKGGNTLRKIKPETEIKNLKKELRELRVVCEGFGIPLLIVYCPQIAIKDLKMKEPRKLTKTQNEWLKSKIKEFNKLLAE